MKQLALDHTDEKQLVFVVQKHKATSLHYDFRLQIGKTMPSWAIPKGPTLDPLVKRLAMETTDHTMEYRNFEGVLPEGGYGAGPVMIWDEGEYIPEIEVPDMIGGSKGKKMVRERVESYDDAQQVMKSGLKKGEIKFFLNGKKLKGSFALVKTKGFGPKNSWLLIKHADEYVKKGYDANAETKSAKSGRTIEEIAALTE